MALSSRQDARDTLVRALESLDEVEAEVGEAKRMMLCVCWAYSTDGRTVRGWNATDEPDFVTVALLRTIADWIENPGEPAEDDAE